MARLVGELVQWLDVPSIALATGGSLGGMVAMEFAATYPTLARNNGRASCAGRASGVGDCVESHPAPDDRRRAGDEGLEIARMIAMMTYRTAGELADRFGREEHEDGGFAVERYLSRQGEKLRARFDVHTYLTLARRDGQPRCWSRSGRSRERVGFACTGRSLVSEFRAIFSMILCSDVRRWNRGQLAPSIGRSSRRRGTMGFLLEVEQVSSLLREALTKENGI